MEHGPQANWPPTTSWPASNRPVFAVGGRTYGVGQIVQAADFRGELRPCWERWKETYTRAQAAEEGGLEVDSARLEEMANDYRYERDLTTAEECEQWLAARGLTPEDFLDYLARRYWAEQPVQGPTPADPDGESPTHGCLWLFGNDLLLSDQFERMASQLAWRVALDQERMRKEMPLSGQAPAGTADGTAGGPRPSLTAPPAYEDGASPAEKGHWVFPLDGEWLQELKRLEDQFRAYTRTLLSPEYRQRGLASLRLSLLRLELEMLDFDSPAAAQEAFLCVSQDGMSMKEVAREGGYPLQTASLLLEELPAEWHQAFHSARPGTALPPFNLAGRYQLSFIKSKLEPFLEDPAVRARVDRAILDQHFKELEARHLQWFIPPEARA